MNRLKTTDINNQVCHSLTQEGAGVVRLPSGKVAFVEGLLPDEKADLEIIEEKQSFVAAQVKKLNKASPNRIKPPCKLADLCGGCTVQPLKYEEQLRWKENIVRQNLQRIGGFSESTSNSCLQPILGMQMAFPQAYRNKVQLPCRLTTNQDTGINSLEIGYFTKRTHRIVPRESCLLQPALFTRIEEEIKIFWEKQPDLCADCNGIHSLLRHLLLRYGQHTKQVMVVLVLSISANAPQLQKIRPLFENLAQHLKTILHENQAELTSFYINFQTAPPPAILGKELDLIFGESHIQEKIGDFVYTISPHSFFQVNTEQTEVLYRKVLEAAKLRPSDEVFDLYCGTGSISLFLAKQAHHVTGIEIVPQAIADAIKNAKQNNLSDKTTFLCGPAEVLGPKLCAEGRRPHVVVLDPPRKGCDTKLLKAVCEMAPERIVYVSCNPATLARDLKFLAHPIDSSSGVGLAAYQIESLTPVDLFPHTLHVETVALLCRKDIDSRIEVKLELDEDDVTKAESKGTYENIKEYVLDNYGFKVSTLYIAQIKRKCGLELHENYNKSKKENSRVPECPKEKEEAIMDALRHFGMIVQEG